MRLNKYPHQFFKFLKSNFYEDYYNLILWPIAFYAFGIMFYFSLKSEPGIHLILGYTATSAVLLFIFRKQSAFRIILTLLFCFSLGILISTYRTQNIAFTKLETPLDKVRLTGKVDKVYPLIVGQKVILKDVRVYEYRTLKARFGKVQVTVKTSGEEYQTGDYISLYASLQPVSTSMFPGKYDFARHAYFEQIAAIGFAVSKVKITRQTTKLSISSFVEKIRWKILKKLYDEDVKNPSIIAALMLGEQKAIDKDTMNDMRNSGLTHILSVSGLHLSLVSIICFFVVRYTLSNFVSFAQLYNTKKIAAWISLFATFAYLLLSGMQIAALRSFIMVAFIIIAILLDREDDARRSVCFAALLVLLFTPEAILHPSFQMSFSAVLALVSLYSFYSTFSEPKHNKTLIGKVVAYFLGVLCSSLTAGLATAMFVVYHFNNYSNYSVIANLLAAALVSLIIMPSIVITFLFLPFGNAYKVGTFFMDLGIDLMLKIASYISNLSKAVVMLPPISAQVLVVFVCGFLWLCLWQARWRFFGFVPMFAALAMLLLADFPAVIVDSKYKTVLLRTQDGMISFAGKKRVSSWHEEQWATLMNVNTIEKIDHHGEHHTLDYLGYKLDLDFEYDAKDHPKIAQLKLANAYNEINISKEDLEAKGSYFIYLKPKNISVQYTIDKSIQRPWS